MNLEALLLHHRVETFLFHEADLLDRWQLDEWFALFAEGARYLVPPLDVVGEEPEPDPDTSLFYIVDDHARLRERVVRLGKDRAHSEWPRSRTLHQVSNVLVERVDGGLSVRAGFAVHRSKDGNTDVYIGHYRYRLVEQDDELRIAEKKCVLALDALRPHGRISILL